MNVLTKLFPTFVVVSAVGFAGYWLTRDPAFITVSIAALTGACAIKSRKAE